MEAESQYDDETESAWGTIIGWGALALFAIGFAWYVGAPLIVGEKWANKKDQAVDLVKNSKPNGATQSLYDLIRAYSLGAHQAATENEAKGKEHTYIGEFSWDALQREGPNYEVTLLWTEGTQKRVALWRVNLEDGSIWPQGTEANALVNRVTGKTTG